MATSTDRQQRFHALVPHDENPYELQDIPLRTAAVPAHPHQNYFHDNGSPRDSVLELDNIPLQPLAPVYPTITPGTTAAWIKARRADYPHIAELSRYMSPEESSASPPPYHSDTEDHGDTKRRSWKSLLGSCITFLAFLILFFMIIFLVAIGIMDHEGKLGLYLADGQCRIFGGLEAASWRCVGLD